MRNDDYDNYLDRAMHDHFFGDDEEPGEDYDEAWGDDDYEPWPPEDDYDEQHEEGEFGYDPDGIT